jgi:hypothetical protein
LCRQDAAVGDEEIRDRERAQILVDDTPERSLAAIRHPPTKWAKRSIVMASSGPAAWCVSVITLVAAFINAWSLSHIV